MLFAIHAFEQMYEGLHGIEEYAVVDCADETEAYDIASDMSAQVIEDYIDHIDLDMEDYDDYFDYGRDFVVWRIKDTDKTLEELNDMIVYDPNDFIDEYCIEI